MVLVVVSLTGERRGSMVVASVSTAMRDELVAWSIRDKERERERRSQERLFRTKERVRSEERWVVV